MFQSRAKPRSARRGRHLRDGASASAVSARASGGQRHRGRAQRAADAAVAGQAAARRLLQHGAGHQRARPQPVPAAVRGPPAAAVAAAPRPPSDGRIGTGYRHLGRRPRRPQVQGAAAGHGQRGAQATARRAEEAAAGPEGDAEGAGSTDDGRPAAAPAAAASGRRPQQRHRHRLAGQGRL